MRVNDGELARAMIAAVQLRLPPLDWHGAVRILQAENALAKDDFNPDEPRVPAGEPRGGEWTTGGGSAAGIGPVPALTALDELSAPPSPPLVGGRFPAPAGPGSNPLLHPAQAEEDENGRGGLLGDYVEPFRDLRLERYQELRAKLQELEPGNPVLWNLRRPDYVPSWADVRELDAALRDAEERAGEPPDPRWQLGWSARGCEFELERLLGQRTLPSNTRIIDDFRDGIAISIKSIDLNAPSYRDPLVLSRVIDRYVDQLSAYNGTNWGNARIREDEIRGRLLDIVLPKNSATLAQRQAITTSIERAHTRGGVVFISPY